MTTQLSPEQLAVVEDEGKKGRAAWKNGDLPTAEQHFLAAWNALPEPSLEQEYAQILSRGITTFYRDTKQFEKAKKWIETTRQAYGPGDPSVEFLAGTVAFESGDLDEAYRLFHPLYLKYADRPFEGHTKYLDFTRNRSHE
ncbi:MAG TPA: hypothetical protein VGL22_10865 [Terracidiphilus sp.]|jgi:hypothetical protein